MKKIEQHPSFTEMVLQMEEPLTCLKLLVVDHDLEPFRPQAFFAVLGLYDYEAPYYNSFMYNVEKCSNQEDFT